MYENVCSSPGTFRPELSRKGFHPLNVSGRILSFAEGRVGGPGFEPRLAESMISLTLFSRCEEKTPRCFISCEWIGD